VVISQTAECHRSMGDIIRFGFNIYSEYNIMAIYCIGSYIHVAHAHAMPALTFDSSIAYYIISIVLNIVYIRVFTV
jgi:hypothetical protein